MNKEVRNFIGEVRAERENNTVYGVPVVFNSPTDIGGLWREIIEPSAVTDKTLKDVRFLVNHDTNGIPLARSRNNTTNSTMRLSIENDGVHMVSDLDRNNPKAVELLSAIERGDISGMSFMFTVDGDSWDDLDSDYPTRHITSIAAIYEVSAVTFPAYEDTSITARSLENGKASLDSAREALENAKRRSARIEELNKRLEEK